MVPVDVDGGGPAVVPPRRSRNGGRELVLLLLLGLSAAFALAGCVLGQPGGSSSAAEDGAADMSEAAAPAKPPDGNAGGPAEGEPGPTADGGAGGPTEATTPAASPSSGELTPAESSACTQVPATDDAAMAALAGEPPPDAASTAATGSVADLFDAAADQVAASVDELPDGDVREAVIAYQAAQEAMADALHSGRPPLVEQIAEAERALQAVCAGG